MSARIVSIPTGERAPVDARLFADLAGLVGLAGSADFYEALSSFVARITATKKRLVMRYAAYDRPAFIINKALGEEAAALYLSGLYRIDPLYTLSRTNREPLVVNLRGATDHVSDEQYLAALFKSAFIFDEIAVLLPTYGGVTIAVCCERAHRRFAQAEIDTVEAMLPLLQSVHKVHMDRVFSTAGKRAAAEDGGSEAAMMLLDSRNEAVGANAAWEACQHVAGRLPGIVARIEERGTSHILLGDGHVVHWERLPADFYLAPNGCLLTLGRRSPGPLEMSAQSAVEGFCKAYALTRREADIVRLSLIGQPNAVIAGTLGVSVGTVKNHRWRIYAKLDITSERELFRLFIATLLAIEIAVPPADSRDGKEAAAPRDQASLAAPAGA